MIKLFSLKQQKKDGGGGQTSKTSGTQKKASAAQLRVQKGTNRQNMLEKLWFYVANFCVRVEIDINELNLPKTCSTEFPDPDDLLTFKLIICPDEGFYSDGRFAFNFKVFGGRDLWFYFLWLIFLSFFLGGSKLSARTAKGQVRNASVPSEHWSGR